MKQGRGSRTAVLVCKWRALADGKLLVGRFSDPTALALLPEADRNQVRAEQHAGETRSFSGRIAHSLLARRVPMMAVRTVVIDDALRAGRSPQVVILGAGLDGRAYRMQELADCVVFEVDHPDTQAEKRARLAGLTQAAREVRFVAVDFARDPLAAALKAAGHDSERPTTWIWEGVVMYLTPAQVEETLAVIAARSARGSWLILTYHQHAPLLGVLGLLLRFVGEPLRSVFTPDAMRELLAKYGFRTTEDRDLPSYGRALSPQVGEAIKRTTHTRIATAVRA